MNIIRDPETGFYNSCHAGTYAVGPRRGLISFVTPHSHIIMNKYRAMGIDKMPIAFVFGVPPAYEIMANFSGLHMDMWGEMEMVGTIMDRDIEMVPCETHRSHRAGAGRDRGRRLRASRREVPRSGEVTSPSMYHLPHREQVPEVEITAHHHAGGPADLPQSPDLPGHRPPDAAAPLPRGGALQPADRDRAQGEGRALSRPGARRSPASCSSIIRARASSTTR